MNNWSIRPAVPQDAAFAAPLIAEAIGEIACRLTGKQEGDQVEKELTAFFKQKTNRHSYLYTWVAQIESTPVGLFVLYEGRVGKQVDALLSKWLQETGAPIFSLDTEAHDDEWYIDTLCVHPDFRGQGVGTFLLEQAEKIAKQSGAHKLSLNVEVQKERARLLYERLGFNRTELWMIAGKHFHHLVKLI